MKVLLTGAGGYVGNSLVQFFAGRGVEVYALYNLTFPAHKDTRVHLIQADLGIKIKDLEPVDIIIHCATVHPFSRSLPNALDYVDSNINATRNLLDYGISCSARLFIYLSTVTVHGNIQAKVLNENTPQHEPNLLGMTKYLAERVVETYADRLPSVILRLPGIVGPELLALQRPWLCSVLQKAIRNEPIRIFNGSSSFNNVTDITDIGNLIVLLMEKWNSGVDIFNLAAQSPLKLNQVVQNIINQTQSDSEIIEEQNNKNSFYINIDKVLNQLQFMPKTTEAMIQRFVQENTVI